MKPQLETLSLPDQDVEILRIPGGPKPRAILLPGARGGISGYRDFAALLAAKGVPAIGINPRGCGASNGRLDGITLHDFARDVLAVADRTAEDPLLLIGHAGGNRTARMAATLEPGRVAAIVLVAAGGKFRGAQESLDARARLVAGEAKDRAEVRALTHKAFFAPTSTVPDWYLDVPDHSFDYARAFDACQKTVPVEEWWAGGGKPMLVVQGTQDQMAPPANGHDIAKQYPDRVRVVDVDNCGHILPVEQPDVVAGLIADYAREMGVR